MQVEIQVISGPAKGQRFTFDKPDRFLFGRAADAHISLPNDQYVSRRHFLLEIAPPACKLTDLNSKNGVVVNGIRYGGQKPPKTGVKQVPDGAKEVHLKNGDEIVVGDTHIKVFIQAESGLPEPLTESAQPKQSIRCRLCGKDVTDEAGPLTQKRQAEYVCSACREKVPKKELTKILNEALTDKTTRLATPSSSDLLNLKGYQIEHEMKHSGTGRIYKATETKTGRSVAIKTLLSQGNVDPYHVSVFQREMNILRQLKHKHIVRFLDYGETEDLFYFIFEFVEGMDLAKFIQSKGGRVSIHDTVPIALGILDGLAYAHHAKITLEHAEGNQKTFTGIVHRNLKPQNILLARQAELWVPKIADFGLSKSFESAGLTNITTPGDVFGTPVYWPREQITHYRYLNPATDVFSIAAVFYEMLTGTWVREGFKELAHKYKQLRRLPSISDFMSVITTNPPLPIRQRNPNIPEPLAKVIDQALREIEIPPDEVKMREILRTLRYPDAGAFRNALVKAFREIGVPESLITAQERYHEPSEENLAKEQPETAQPRTEVVMYSTIQSTSRREVALLVLDIVQSTQYLLNEGDTVFSTLIRNIFQRVKTHASASDLIFLKGSGDGFLSVFQTISAAFSLATTFLETPIHPEIQVRLALHWGSVKINPDGDVLGTEVSRVSRIQGVTIQDRIDPTISKEPLPSANRILATTQALKRLDPVAQARFRPAGKFRLKSFDKFGELWVLYKEKFTD